MTMLRRRSFWFGVLILGNAAWIIFVLQGPWFSSFRYKKLEAPSNEWPVYGTLPDFKLTERSGRQISLSDLKDQVWIADFIFTRCAGICPMMSGKMKQLQQKLKNVSGLRFVSFSVDPEHDTPQALRVYAQRYGADPEKWLFLTGDKSQLFKLSSQHFYLGVEDIPENQREALDQTVQHSSKFVLVDQEGRIRGYYASEEEDSLRQLVKDAKQLSFLRHREAAAGSRGDLRPEIASSALRASSQ